MNIDGVIKLKTPYQKKKKSINLCKRASPFYDSNWIFIWGKNHIKCGKETRLMLLQWF